MEQYAHKFDVYLGRDKNPQIKRAMPILTGLGCSYKCTFCEHALMGNRHHALNAEDIVEQMNHYYEKYNIDSFAFFDEEFLSDKERIFELTDLLKKNKNKFNWGTQVRASDVHEKYINKDRLQQIEDSGCIRFSMGVESGSPRMLKKIKKGLTPELVMRAANFGKDSKIVFSYSFIVNLPTETNEELQMTINLAKKLESVTQTTKPEDIQTIVYSTGKENGYENKLREWFILIYEVLFGSVDGPRMGFFISFFGVKETIKLIEDKVNK